MEKQYPWKRTDEIEVDLADLLRRLCGKWKQIAACALALAVILGAYGWMKSGRSPDADAEVPATAEEMELEEEEEQAVASAVLLVSEINSLEAYMDNSVLMQLDAYHKNKFIMLYSIDRAKRQELPRITESYLNYIGNGGALDALKKRNAGASKLDQSSKTEKGVGASKLYKLDKSYLAELVAAYQKTYSSPYQVSIEGPAADSVQSESLFYVEVTGKNAGLAKQMALDLQEVLKGYSAKVAKQAGDHKLTLVSSTESVTADHSLQAQQHDKKALLSSNKTALKTMTDAFSKGQMEIYRKQAGVEEEDIGQEDAEGKVSARSLLKYVVLGIAGGIFLYCGIYTCGYLFLDSVKSADELKRLYTFPLYGDIHSKGTNTSHSRKAGRKLPGVRQDGTRETEEAQALNRIRLSCSRHGITKLYAVSGTLLEETEKRCLEHMAGQLESDGIRMAVAENAGRDPAAWEELAETGNVLLVCRIGTTTHRMIDDAMGFYLENGIAVVGAVAFS